MTKEQTLTARLAPVLMVLGAVMSVLAAGAGTGADAKAALARRGIRNDICVVLGLPEGGRPESLIDLVGGTQLQAYFQSPDPEEVAGVREGAAAAGLLSTQICVEEGAWASIGLADNLAGAILVGPAARSAVSEAELLRVLHPEGTAIMGDKEIVKPVPDGVDDWSHPYHGPDNNPQSTDRLARAPFLTKFLAEPMFSPMPQVSVAAGGRVFRAFGHIAHKANQNAVLNTLVCINGYNGRILWKRDLTGTFMIHRNAMVATPDILYLADEKSCTLIDARTGAVKDEIVIPAGLADGTVWKWMALSDGVLYALIGGPEVPIVTQRSNTLGLGHWPWGMWAGHDYKDPKTSFGFGRTLVAVDPATKKIIWSHREEEYLDSRGVCMKNGRIYFCCPEKFLGCLDGATGQVRWKSSAPELLAAIGPNGAAQHYVTGYATTTYVKCTDGYILFAGPQRSRLVVVRAEDGALLWHKKPGNLQLVLRDDGFYAAGPQHGGVTSKMAYETGAELARLPQRRACTRATGTLDSIFFRATGGTVRIDTASNTAQHIAPMRPPCHDGVIIADGNLYWGPWMCGCQLSLYGHICLSPAGSFRLRGPAAGSRLETGAGDIRQVADFAIEPGDWPCYLGNNHRSPATEVTLPRQLLQRWAFSPPSACMATAPVAAGGMVFTGDRSGVVRALDAAGKVRWKAFTGGAVYFPPAVSNGRVYAGSADGCVYAFEAASGRLLWRFRVGPAQRRIPVYGTLISTWPVAGGVVVEDGIVYAAAGIAHYDGTHVVALDAVTGEVKWYNDSSGTLSEKVKSGISLQGGLHIRGGELRFLGGGVYETARYDLKTGQCLNAPYEGVDARFQTAFYAYYPFYGQYLSFHHTFLDGTSLAYEAAYEGSRHSSLARWPARTPGADARAARRRGQPDRAALWERGGCRYNCLILGPEAVLAAGQTGTSSAFLALIDLKNGTDLWNVTLPAAPVKGGVAVDHEARIIVSLENGQVLCFAAE